MNNTKKMFNKYFLSCHKDSFLEYEKAINSTLQVLIKDMDNDFPYSGAQPKELAKLLTTLKLFSEQGENLEDVLKDVQQIVLKHNIRVSDPKTIGHLHCPPLIPALSAEMIISAFNQSMDSWDQSPSATYVEKGIVSWLCEKFKYPLDSDGVFTSGGTQSNYMGLLLARNQFCMEHFNVNIQKKGLPSQAQNLRILCSEKAHFTVKQAAAQLGLGEDAVITIKTDKNYRMCIEDLNKKINKLKLSGLLPFSIVATCGTTDFGSIDPINEISQIAKKNNLWLHIDAAYGGALIFSEKYQEKLSGIEKANSITIDFHKLLYQPISCGAFLVKENKYFNFIKMHADYLNPEDDESNGIINLVNKSTQTTRRFDALKLLISLRVVGISNIAKMIDNTINLAKDTANILDRHPNFEVINTTPEINAVVFRYITTGRNISVENNVNFKIHHELLQRGSAFVAKTMHQDKLFLKFTLLNPCTNISHIKEILDEINLIGYKYISIEKKARENDTNKVNC